MEIELVLNEMVFCRVCDEVMGWLFMWQSSSSLLVVTHTICRAISSLPWMGNYLPAHRMEAFHQ
jgi:hypothetical protein